MTLIHTKGEQRKAKSDRIRFKAERRRWAEEYLREPLTSPDHKLWAEEVLGKVPARS